MGKHLYFSFVCGEVSLCASHLSLHGRVHPNPSRRALFICSDQYNLLAQSEPAATEAEQWQQVQHQAMVERRPHAYNPAERHVTASSPIDIIYDGNLGTQLPDSYYSFNSASSSATTVDGRSSHFNPSGITGDGDGGYFYANNSEPISSTFAGSSDMSMLGYTSTMSQAAPCSMHTMHGTVHSGMPTAGMTTHMNRGHSAQNLASVQEHGSDLQQRSQLPAHNPYVGTFSHAPQTAQTASMAAGLKRKAVATGKVGKGLGGVTSRQDVQRPTIAKKSTATAAGGSSFQFLPLGMMSMMSKASAASSTASKKAATAAPGAKTKRKLP